jgi:hypothetical protein
MTNKNSKTTPKTAKQSAKQSTKTTPKTETKKILTHAERSAIARLAAFKAHLHKTFQSDRTASEQKAQRAKFTSAQRAFDRTPLARKVA